jgi:hypothetical protein
VRNDRDALKLAEKIDKKCGAEQLAFDVLATAVGGNVAALADTCDAFGVAPLATLGAYETCLFRRHQCSAEDLLRLQAPRVAEMLALLGQSLDSGFCPLP